MENDILAAELIVTQVGYTRNKEGRPLLTLELSCFPNPHIHKSRPQKWHSFCEEAKPAT